MAKVRKNLTLVVLALLVAGCTTVFAAMDYSFVLEELSKTAYSRESFTKTDSCVDAYFRQTGSSPGTYSVRYNVVTYNGHNVATLSKTVSSTDYSSKTVDYNEDYRDETGINMLLKGYYLGTGGPVTITGKWNPVD